MNCAAARQVDDKLRELFVDNHFGLEIYCKIVTVTRLYYNETKNAESKEF